MSKTFPPSKLIVENSKGETMPAKTNGGEEYAIICSADGGRTWHEVADGVEVKIDHSPLNDFTRFIAEGYRFNHDKLWKPKKFFHVYTITPISADALLLPTKQPEMNTRSVTPTRIIQRGKATVVWWCDGTKTVVKRYAEDEDPEKALAMALARKVWGRSKTARYVKRIERADAE